jgi:hypothetical protein
MTIPVSALKGALCGTVDSTFNHDERKES